MAKKMNIFWWWKFVKTSDEKKNTLRKMSGTPQKEETPSKQQQQIPLEQIPIDSFPAALGLTYRYLDLATRRGAFQLDEAAKVMSCLNFMGRVVHPRRPSQQQPPASSTPLPNKPNGTTEQQGIKRKQWFSFCAFLRIHFFLQLCNKIWPTY